MHLVRRLTAQGLMRAMLVVPIDDKPDFTFEFGLILGDCDQSQNLFQRPG